LCDVASDAIWSWRDSTVWLPNEEGKAIEVRIRTPAQSVLWPATRYGGRERATTMRAAPRLQHEGGGIRLAWMFADEDGYAPPTREERAGRLDFDGAALVMIDRETNQTLTFERTLEGSADASREQLGMFRYRDDQTDYPIVVQRTSRVDQDAGADWIIDHEASAERWRSTSELESDPPSYPPQDVWRRVASFASDALLAWPDTAAFGPAPRAVIAASGWWAGRWEPGVRRHCMTRLLTDMTWRRIREQRLHERSPLAMAGEDPRVPVSSHADPEPTPAWKAHASAPVDLRSRDMRDAFGPTTPTIALDPPGALSVEPVDLAAFAAERLVDRQHWLREDGCALLYVCGEHTVMRGGPEPTDIIEPLFEYCDADVRLRLQFSYASAFDHPLSLIVLLWPRVVRGSECAEHDGALPASLYLPNPGTTDGCRPHARLWHRLVDALEAWVDPLRGGRRAAVAVRGVYLAGAFDPMGERRTWLEEKVQAHAGR
jgi:hypothetical protein